MLDVEEAPATSKSKKKTKNLVVDKSITSFLEDAANNIQPYNPDAVILDYQDTNFSRLKELLALGMQNLHDRQFSTLNHYVLVGNILRRLKRAWPKSDRYSFYSYCYEVYTIKNSTVNHYIHFSIFLKTYPKFRSTGLCYSALRDILSRLEQHFRLAQFKNLPKEDCLSPAYWKEVPGPIE